MYATNYLNWGLKQATLGQFWVFGYYTHTNPSTSKFKIWPRICWLGDPWIDDHVGGHLAARICACWHHANLELDRATKSKALWWGLSDRCPGIVHFHPVLADDLCGVRSHATVFHAKEAVDWGPAKDLRQLHIPKVTLPVGRGITPFGRGGAVRLLLEVWWKGNPGHSTVPARCSQGPSASAESLIRNGQRFVLCAGRGGEWTGF